MYQPRRIAELSEDSAALVDDPTVSPSQPTSAQAFTARRAAGHWYDGLSRKLGVAAVAVTVLGAGGFGFAASQGTAVSTSELVEQVAADRALTVTSRSAERRVQVGTLATSELQQATDDLTSLTPLYTTGTLNLREEADSKSSLITTVGSGEKVLATSIIDGKYRLVEAEKGSGWVLAANLTTEAEADGITEAKCSRGTAVENKLRKDTIRIYRSVCALFPGVNSYGGWRAGGRQFHKNGRALDIMLTPTKESALGWKIANYLVKNYKAFNIDHIIFEQKIWTPSTPRWRHMADRGGITANHYDHVHAAVKA